ncbi:unnamed protein product [Fraxinus pennsylvanica]|uniref:DCD domain-containing protein n=1 Tax=Fraxinus pennsylvanica TaxID=56036 RepID=A0AAD2E7H9_9LAMI|nr:unnamed protein product [Fraxinus pennsylvanica]
MLELNGQIRIYEAFSAGGMKLELAAYGELSLPRDCFLLPENMFKKAIKDKYNERIRKYKTELTASQVKYLSSLFQPTPKLRSSALVQFTDSKTTSVGRVPLMEEAFPEIQMVDDDRMLECVSFPSKEAFHAACFELLSHAALDYFICIACLRCLQETEVNEARVVWVDLKREQVLFISIPLDTSSGNNELPDEAMGIYDEMTVT